MLIDRPLYLKRLERLREPSLVKVLVGVRRGGKSSLLELFADRLANEGVPSESIVTVNYELPSQAGLKAPRALYEFVRSRVEQADARFLFIDEVQELEGWAEAVNGLRAEFRDLDIYVTGSNARLFAGEKLTYLSGRSVTVEVYPLSFREHLSFTREIDPSVSWEDLSHSLDLARALGDYVRTGGFPAVVMAAEPELRRTILDGLYDSVFTRDLLLRGKIRNEAAFTRVARFILDNIGNPTSANSIARTLKSSGQPVGADTVERFLSLITQAYLAYRCDRFDVRGKEHLRTRSKYYAVDQALRRRITGAADRDRGRVLENLVYLELRRRGYDVFTGKIGDLEIDFVARRDGSTSYVQVSERLDDPATLARELAPFRGLKDHHPCYVLSTDWLGDELGDGVRFRNLYEFLLGRPLE